MAEESVISKKLRKRLEGRVESARDSREALLDVILEIQEERGWMSDECVEEAARITGLSPLQVEELSTFYNLIFRRPVGEKVILVCDSISCWTMGSDNVVDHLKKRLAVDFGETTGDDKFTLLPVCCIGHCDKAPVMRIGSRVYGNLTPELIDEAIEKERD
jgi:NADH-quinone oxidoreductase subunit E